MLPAFIDGHGHMYNVGFVSMFASLLPPPDGPGADYSSIINALDEYKDTEDGKWALNKFGWIVGFGYDDSQLTEKDHPKASDLDKVSKDVPVMIIHQSGHLASINTKGSELVGWTGKDTQDPEGGKLRRDDGGKPNGVIEENAFQAILLKLYSKADEEVDQKAIQLGQDQYAKNGYLTAQEGGSTPGIAQALVSAANNGDLYIDVVSYPYMTIDGAYDLLSNEF